MRVLIVGCGYIGCRLGAELVRNGHSVWGLRRSPGSANQFSHLGIKPLLADICVPESLPPLGRAYDWVVHCVSSGGGDAKEYDQVYFQGTLNLIAWLSAAPPSKLVYTSSTSVYGQIDGGWVDEGQAAPGSPTAQVLLRTEELLLSASAGNKLPAVILRVAGIYGPGRVNWLERIRQGNLRTAHWDHAFLNMIHCDDVVGAIRTALERAAGGTVYNAVDNEPVTRIEFLEWLTKRLGLPTPEGQRPPGTEVKRGLTNKRVSNLRLKTELAYQLRFPTFREGYEQVLSIS